MQGASGKPPASNIRRSLCRKQSPMAGPDAPTLAREKGLQPYGALDCFGRRSEGGAGGRAESPLLASIVDNFAVRNSPLMGNDAPKPAQE